MRSAWSRSILGAVFLWSQLQWAVHPNPPVSIICFVWCVGSATLGICFGPSFGCRSVMTCWIIQNLLGCVISWVLVTCNVWWYALTFSLCSLLRTLSLFVIVHVINMTGIVINDKKNIKYRKCLGCTYFLFFNVWFGYGVSWVCSVVGYFFSWVFFLSHWWAAGGEQFCQSGPLPIPTSLVLIATHIYFLSSIFPWLCKQELILSSSSPARVPPQNVLFGAGVGPMHCSCCWLPLSCCQRLVLLPSSCWRCPDFTGEEELVWLWTLVSVLALLLGNSYCLGLIWVPRSVAIIQSRP